MKNQTLITKGESIDIYDWQTLISHANNIL
jgi:hypothetical protein